MNTPVIDENSELGKKSRWYIVHTYSGFEQRVQKTIKAMMDSGEDNGLIQEVVVPTEKVIEPSKNGSQPRTTTRKFYPRLCDDPHDYDGSFLPSGAVHPQGHRFCGGKTAPLP